MGAGSQYLEVDLQPTRGIGVRPRAQHSRVFRNYANLLDNRTTMGLRGLHPGREGALSRPYTRNREVLPLMNFGLSARHQPEWRIPFVNIISFGEDLASSRLR